MKASKPSLVNLTFRTTMESKTIKVTHLNGEVSYFTLKEFSEYKKIFQEYNPLTGFTPNQGAKQ